MKIHVLQAINSPFHKFSWALSADAAAWGIADDYAFVTPITFTAEYFYNGKTLEVQGRLKAKIKTVCSRCLADLIYPIDQEVSAVFSNKPDEEALEYPITESRIELSQVVLDEVLASLPMRFLCQEDCKGLCPVCGTDLNVFVCDCDPTLGMKTPFEDLKDLFD